MHFTAPLLTLLSVLPLLASATPDAQPAGGLVIKQVDLSLRKRQATTTTGGSYVTSWSQCTDVCVGYFGKPAASSSSVPAANNAVVATSTTKASSVKPSSTTAAITTRTTSISTSKASTTSVAPTTRATTSTASTRPSSAAISSARSSSAAPATTSASGGGTTTAAQRQLILDLHNQERADWGASALTWNTALEKYAYDYASKCQWKHSGGPNGENLAASYGYPDAISQGINGWNAERSEYNPQAPAFSHFTQVVWKGTSQVGCALVSCPAGSIQPGWGVTSYLVCEYQAPGNYAGQYGTNVGPRVAA